MHELTLFLAHDSYVLGLAFTADGGTLISAGMDKTLRLWSAADWQPQAVLQAHANSVNGFALSADGRTLVTGSTDETVRIWSFPELTLQHTLQDRKKVVAAVAMAPNATFVAAGSYGGRVAVWTLQGQPQAAWTTTHKNVASVAISPDSRLLAVSGLGDTVGLWEARTGNPVWSLAGHETAVSGLKFIQGGEILVTLGYEQSIRFWDTFTYQSVRKIDLPGRGLRGFTFSADEQRLALSLESLVEVRRVADWELLASLPVTTKVINGMAFSPDGRLLALGGADKKIRVWEVD